MGSARITGTWFGQFSAANYIICCFLLFFLYAPAKTGKTAQGLVSALAKGDEIATNGGILGKIKEVGDNFLLVEIAEGTDVKVQKQSVSVVLPKGTLKTL